MCTKAAGSDVSASGGGNDSGSGQGGGGGGDGGGDGEDDGNRGEQVLSLKQVRWRLTRPNFCMANHG